MNQAYKLSVLPNLQLASLFYETPDDILNHYQEKIDGLLNNPNEYVPNIFPMLKTVPCEDCPFMTEILATNYRSFYAYFNQLIKEKKVTGNRNITEMY